MMQALVTDQIKRVKTINIIKIALLVFISFSLLANFYPFYSDKDSLVYGIASISLANGSYSYTSELLKETGLSEFIPVQWVKTIHDTTIPKTAVGMYGFSTSAYLIAGEYGLFYLGPIFTIIFLISAERIATNLFGRFVGLVTLILLVSDAILTIIGRQLMTDNIFSLFFILGCFFLIKFLREKKNIFIFLGTLFFVVSAFIRLPGSIFLPLEILIIVGYFAYEAIYSKKKNFDSKNLIKVNYFKFFKIGIIVAIPWIVFILFWFSFNTYYFGDPLTTYLDASRPESIRDGGKSLAKFFVIDSKFFEYVKYYSISFLPDNIRQSLMDSVLTQETDQFDHNWVGLFSLLIFLPALIITFYDKAKRTEVIIFIIFIVAWISIYSSNYIAPSIENHINTFLRDRSMIPLLPLFFMLFGLVIDRLWRINFKNLKHFPKLADNSFRVMFIIFVSILLLSSLYMSHSSSEIINQRMNIKDPYVYAEQYPPDREGLPEKSVIVGSGSREALAYDFTSFYPYWGIGRYSETTPDTIPKKPIQTLTKLLEEGYDTFMFKGGFNKRDISYFEFLEAEHGIILQNYTKTFCKLQLTNTNSELDEPTEIKRDDICYLRTTTDMLCVEGKCFGIVIQWGPDEDFIP